MSYGCCDLVSDIPENTEVTGDYAVQFPKGNVDVLRQKLQDLLDNPKTVDSYKSKSADYITSRYSWDLAVQQMLRIYRGEMVEYDTVYKESLKGAK
jgi:glycosyltransferase involved in cell wall biosynthesis